MVTPFGAGPDERHRDSSRAGGERHVARGAFGHERRDRGRRGAGAADPAALRDEEACRIGVEQRAPLRAAGASLSLGYFSSSALRTLPPSSVTRSTSVVTVTASVALAARGRASAAAPRLRRRARHAGRDGRAVRSAPRRERCRCSTWSASQPAALAARRSSPCPTPSTAGSPPSARRRAGRRGSGSCGAARAAGRARQQMRRAKDQGDGGGSPGRQAAGIVPPRRRRRQRARAAAAARSWRRAALRRRFRARPARATST